MRPEQRHHEFQRAGVACEIWGVLNTTPDSFSDGGSFVDVDVAMAHATALVAAGADVIDVGGESTRPKGKAYGEGAVVVDAREEISRVMPVIERLLRLGNVRVSVDTTKAEVAEAAMAAGVRIVNDVSGGASEALLRAVAKWDAVLVLMHNRGRGEVTQRNATYYNVVREVCDELRASVDRALHAGVSRDRIWVDPGIGFAKTAEQSATLLARTDAIVELGLPVLVGPSRKAFIGELSPKSDGSVPAPRERLAGGLAAITAAVLGGARAVRVHDVAEAKQSVDVALAMVRARAGSAPC